VGKKKLVNRGGEEGKEPKKKKFHEKGVGPSPASIPGVNSLFQKNKKNKKKKKKRDLEGEKAGSETYLSYLPPTTYLLLFFFCLRFPLLLYGEYGLSMKHSALRSLCNDDG
jgi:hypothetical protein